MGKRHRYCAQKRIMWKGGESWTDVASAPGTRRKRWAGVRGRESGLIRRRKKERERETERDGDGGRKRGVKDTR